ETRVADGFCSVTGRDDDAAGVLHRHADLTARVVGNLGLIDQGDAADVVVPKAQEPAVGQVVPERPGLRPSLLEIRAAALVDRESAFWASRVDVAALPEKAMLILDLDRPAWLLDGAVLDPTGTDPQCQLGVQGQCAGIGEILDTARGEVQRRDRVCFR